MEYLQQGNERTIEIRDDIVATFGHREEAIFLFAVKFSQALGARKLHIPFPLDRAEMLALGSRFDLPAATTDHWIDELSEGFFTQFREFFQHSAAQRRSSSEPSAETDTSGGRDRNSCFISYSTVDQEFAQQLYNDLQNHGVHCWYAQHDIRGGRKLYEQIDAAVRLNDRLLLVLSDHSMNSEWVKTEIAYARQKELAENRQVLFPISLVPFERIQGWKCFDADTGKDSAREIREYFIPDFSNWRDHDSYQVAFQRLVRDLRPEQQGPAAGR